MNRKILILLDNWRLQVHSKTIYDTRSKLFSLKTFPLPRLNIFKPFGYLSLLLVLGHAETTWALYSANQVATLEEGSTRLVRAANSGGEIVGISRRDTGQKGFFISSDGKLQDIGGVSNTDFSITHGVNDLGQVVGSMNIATGMRAFRSQRTLGGTLLDPLPGDSSSVAFAINFSGKTVGYSSGSKGIRAVTWDAKGIIEMLPMLPNSKYCQAVAINDRADIVGACDLNSGSHAVIWTNNTVRDLGLLPGHRESKAVGINNRGDIIGSSGNIEDQHHAVLWPNGQNIQDLGTLPGRTSSQAFAINNQGDVVGVAEGGGDEHAFIWSKQSGIQDLNTLLSGNIDFVLTHAISLSDNGLIVATGHDKLDSTTGHGHHEKHQLPLRVFRIKPTVGGL